MSAPLSPYSDLSQLSDEEARQYTDYVPDTYIMERWRATQEAARCYQNHATRNNLQICHTQFKAMDLALIQRHALNLPEMDPEPDLAQIGVFMTGVFNLALTLHEAHGEALGVPPDQREVTTETFEHLKFGAWHHLTQRMISDGRPLPSLRPTELFCLSGPLPVPSAWDSSGGRYGCARPDNVRRLAELTNELCASLNAFNEGSQDPSQLDLGSWRIYEELVGAVNATLRSCGRVTLQSLGWTQEQRSQDSRLRDSRTVINHKNEYIAEEASLGCRLALSAQQGIWDNPGGLLGPLHPGRDPGPHSMSYRRLQFKIMRDASNAFKGVWRRISEFEQESEDEASRRGH